MDEQRPVEIETKIVFQEQIIKDLNDVIYEQQEIDSSDPSEIRWLGESKYSWNLYLESMPYQMKSLPTIKSSTRFINKTEEY